MCHRDQVVLRANRAKPAADVSSVSEKAPRQPHLVRAASPAFPAIPKIAGSVRTARYHTAKRARKRFRVLTCLRAVSTLRGFIDRRKEFPHEADVPAESAPPEEDTRLPGAHEDTRRSEGPQAPAREGTQASHRLADAWASPRRPPQALQRDSSGLPAGPARGAAGVCALVGVPTRTGARGVRGEPADPWRCSA